MQSKNQRQARNFDCQSCPQKVQKLRRCREPRFDFDDQDGAIWPMQMSDGGFLYNFCPGKATWDHNAKEVYNLLVLASELKTLYNPGGLIDQPNWFLDLLAFFVPLYDKLKFVSRAQMILGDGKQTTSNPSPRRGFKRM